MSEISGANFAAGRRVDEYDFFRCTKCLTLVTKLQMARALASNTGRGPCACGSLHFSPSNPPDELCEGTSFLRWAWWMVRALCSRDRRPIAIFTLLREAKRA